MIRPLFNMCKIEIVDEYAGVIRNSEEEQTRRGILTAFGLMGDHLTASTGFRIFDVLEYAETLNDLTGKTVHYAEFADSGQVIEEDGKKYAYVPFYRIIGVEE